MGWVDYLLGIYWEGRGKIFTKFLEGYYYSQPFKFKTFGNSKILIFKDWIPEGY